MSDEEVLAAHERDLDVAVPAQACSRWRAVATPPNPPPSTTMRIASFSPFKGMSSQAAIDIPPESNARHP